MGWDKRAEGDAVCEEDGDDSGKGKEEQEQQQATLFTLTSNHPTVLAACCWHKVS